MNSPAINTAIITVTYNCEDFIDAFLTAVAPALTEPTSPSVLVIVDNHSSDETIAKVAAFISEHHLQDKILLRPQQKNLGFGAGCNAGVEAAKAFNAKHYWFLNPDTKVFPQTQQKLLEFLASSPAVSFVGSQLVNEEGVARPSAFRFPSAISELCSYLRLGVLDRIFAQRQVAIPVSDAAHRADWLTGASFMAKADAFDQLNGFDERFFLYFEEVDLFYRAKQCGFECWINPDSKVYHMAGASTGIASGRKATKRRPQYWFDSRRYFYCKNFGRLQFALCDLAAMAGLSLWKVRTVVQGKERNDPPFLLTDLARNSVFSPSKARQ